MREFNKKIAALLVFTVLFSSLSPIFAKKASAFLGIGDLVTDVITNVNTGIIAANTAISAGSDVSQTTKEFGLDSVAWVIVNLILERIAASTVKWINSGFKGSPAFVTDPEAYFKDIGDKVAGTYIFYNPNFNFLCGPLQAKIKLALTQNYIGDNRRWQCTLTQVGRNMDDFMGNFENGGWDNFFELTQRPQNNPIGAYLQAENEMYLQISTRQGTAQKELDQGGGFMSYKKCKPETVRKSEPGPGGLGDCDTAYNSCVRWANGNPATAEAERQKCSATLKSCSAKYANVAVGDCADSDKETVTPGSVIQNQLNKVLGSGGDKLAVADEINEIVSALLNQLVSQVVGGIGRGLKGMSEPGQPDAQGNRSTFTSQLTERKPGDQVVGYFCFDNETDPSSPQYDTDPNTCKYPDTPNTEILNEPLPTIPPATPIINPVPPACDPTNPSFDPTDPSCSNNPTTELAP